MAAVCGVDLHEGRVAHEGPFIARMKAELYGRRIGGRAADRAVRVGDRRAAGDHAGGNGAGLRDGLAEIAAGDVVRGIVVEQRGRIRLLALVPGRSTPQRQSARDPGHQGGLDAPDAKVLTVGVVENIADHTRIEERNLYVVPVLLVDGPVPLQPMAPEFRLPAKLVVGDLIGDVRRAEQVLWHAIGAGGMGRTAVLVEAARAKALRERVVHHDIRRDVICEICSVLEAGLGVAKIGFVEVEFIRETPGGRFALLEAAETADDATLQEVLEQVVTRAHRGRQYLRNHIEVDRQEERRLLGVANLVLIERSIVALNTGIHDARPGSRADVRKAAGIARVDAWNPARGAGRNRLVAPAGLVEQLVVLVICADDAAQAPLVRRAQADFLLQVLVFLDRVPDGAGREASRLERV